MVIFLKIYDSVSFREGFIYSDNPKIIINAPNEVKILSINVREGSNVSKGDTLLILENKKIISDYHVSNLEIETLENEVIILKNLIERAQEKRESFNVLIKIQSDIYQTDINRVKQEIETLNSKIELSKQQTELISNNYKTDSLLYSKGAISRIEFEKQKNIAIENTKSISEIEASLHKKLNELRNISNRHYEKNNILQRNIIDIENQITLYKKDMLGINSKISSKKYNLDPVTEELNRLFIISPINGTISKLFNTRQELKIIAKGELLVTIAPLFENYYAKITLPEKDIIYVKKGQNVNLKVDAYNYYKYGIISGSVSYVSPSDIEDNFYCLVDIKNYHKKIELKAGYKFKGEIIVEELKLYQYIFKMLFNKLDDSINQ